VLGKIVPRILKPLQGSENTAYYDALQRNMYHPYFDANSHIISLLTYLGILLTFGVVFPPLALAMSVTIMSVYWQSRLAVGRFLYQARRLNALKYVNIIELECRGAVTLPKIRRSVLLIVRFSCTFFALFLYDSLASEDKNAYWVLIFVPLVPLFIYAIIRLQRYYKGALTLDYHLDSAARDANHRISLQPVVVSSGNDDAVFRKDAEGIELVLDNSKSLAHNIGPAGKKADGENTTYNVLQV
jgi:hypothetical protein